MRRQVEESDLPDFLHNSPFLPISDGVAYSYPKAVPQPKPTLRQLLKSKPVRASIATFFGLLIFLYLRSRFRSAHVLNRLTGPSCYFTTPQIPNESYLTQDVDWSQFAYALYATNVEYLCNAVMLFESLHRLGTRAERLLMYPETYSLLDTSGSVETTLLLKARDEYSVKLQPVKVQHENTAYYYGPNWADSYTKLLAFNQTQYTRLIVLDSDSTLLSPMDALFFLPTTPAAMPRAYWLTKPLLSSHIMVLTPSPSSFALVQTAIKKARYGVYDMEIMNSLFGSACLTIPHRTYALLSGEYRSEDHEPFLNLEVELDDGREKEEWNPDVVINEAKLVHFSDHPLGKPWVVSEEEIRKVAPGCDKISGWEEECRTRDVWLDLYEDFRRRRKVSFSPF
ncbi:nucleotide-diphospho-sugar transferase [Mollisia scopiformis]|uniref:Nucleotide-diphospho-sugar transferase n=1 Tax=Mollisia scopiformis TaxID=149040 RepID=A0A194X039_MOLSC|nr:nucleotide-diphospho-sugar transferase [Mollisia scopiformis]KUJ13237.1 nucleotide-diphospho-sugar transferase [Mollisia scopiformis]